MKKIDKMNELGLGDYLSLSPVCCCGSGEELTGGAMERY